MLIDCLCIEVGYEGEEIRGKDFLKGVLEIIKVLRVGCLERESVCVFIWVMDWGWWE